MDEESDQVSTSLGSPFQNAASKRPIRQRAGTYGGYTAAESTKIKRTLKGERESGPHGDAKETNEEAKDKIDRLLTEKRKFSRQNRWGNCSYKDLIIHAISSSSNQKMTLNEIYDWIVANIPHFANDQDTNSSVGWKNSIRHNLSLHDVFVKEQQNGTKSIGAYWKLDLSKQKNASGRRRARTMDPADRTAAQKRKSKCKKSSGREMRELNSSPYKPNFEPHFDNPTRQSDNPHSSRDSGLSSQSSQLDFAPMKTTHDAVAALDDAFLKLNTSQPLSENMFKSERGGSSGEITPPVVTSVSRSDEAVTLQLRIPYSAYRLYKKGNYQLCILPNRLLSQQQFRQAVVLEDPDYWEVQRETEKQRKRSSPDCEFKEPALPSVQSPEFATCSGDEFVASPTLSTQGGCESESGISFSSGNQSPGNESPSKPVGETNMYPTNQSRLSPMSLKIMNLKGRHRDQNRFYGFDSGMDERDSRDLDNLDINMSVWDEIYNSEPVEPFMP